MSDPRQLTSSITQLECQCYTRYEVDSNVHDTPCYTRPMISTSANRKRWDLCSPCWGFGAVLTGLGDMRTIYMDILPPVSRKISTTSSLWRGTEILILPYYPPRKPRSGPSFKLLRTCLAVLSNHV